ncbi:MAG: RraA family protein [Sphaerochaeta sp.]
MSFTTEFLNTIEKQLSTAVVCDILDEMGMRSQAMKGSLFPLVDEHKLVGVARTILAYDVFEVPKDAYATEIEAVDSGREGDVFVCVNSSCNNGFWGELMATVSIAKGVRGVLVDGAVRDIAQMRAMGETFKVFAKGRNPNDSNGRALVADYDCPILCDGVVVNSGDLIFADIDGIAVIPQAVAKEVFEKALEKVKKEDVVRAELAAGRSLKDAFAEHQVL